MFEDVMVGSSDSKARMKKTFTMIFSFLIHSTVIFAVIVGPLMKTEKVLPDIKVVDIFVAQTPPQPPQAQRGSKKKQKAKTKREEKKQEEVKKEVPQQIGALVAPIEIPEEIVEEEEDFSSSLDDGLGDGVEGGVEGLGDEDLGSNIIGGDMMDTGSVTRITVKQAKRVKYVKPIYPKIAMNARVRGRVVIEARTDVFGKVISWKVIAGHPLLNGAAINAIRKWEYEPYLVGGVPKPVVFTVTITFSQGGK